MKIRNKYIHIIAAVALLFFCGGSIQAQESESTTKTRGGFVGFLQQLKYGGKVGIGSANLSVDRFSKIGNTRTALTAGIFGEYEFYDKLSVVLGVDYTQNGGSDIDANILYEKENAMWGSYDIYLYKTDLIMHTLEVPVSVRYALANEGTFKPFVLAGGVFGWNMSARANNFRHQLYDGAPQDKLAESSHEARGKMTAVMGSALVGIGTEIKTPQLPFDVEIGVTYRLGLTNLREYKYSLFDKYSSNTTMFYIGVKFGPEKPLFK